MHAFKATRCQADKTNVDTTHQPLITMIKIENLAIQMPTNAWQANVTLKNDLAKDRKKVLQQSFAWYA